MAFVSDFTVPKNLNPRDRGKAFDNFLYQLANSATSDLSSQKEDSETMPLPAEPRQMQKTMRAGAQKLVVRPKPQPLSLGEPSKLSSNVRPHLSLKRRTGHEKQTAKDTNHRFSRKAPSMKGTAFNEKHTDAGKGGSRIPQPNASKNASISREATAQPAVTKREAEKKQATMIEHLENVIIEHELALSLLPSPTEFAEMKKQMSSLEAKVFLRDMENDRLRNENENLAKSLREVKDSNMKMGIAVDDFKKYFGALPPKYRRRDDLRGRPFKDWRRDPTTAVHRPKPINTISTACLDHQEDILPVLAEGDSPLYDSSDGTSSAEDDNVVEPSGWKRQKEDHLESSVQHIKVPASDTPSVAVQSATRVKRTYDGHSSDTDLRLPPLKRFRNSEKIVPVVLFPDSAKDCTSLQDPINPCTRRDESHLQDSIE